VPCPTLSDKPTRATLLAASRRRLLDPNGRWWTDTELNDYIGDWQTEVQDELELVWGTATITTSTATLTLTAVATDILRLDAIYWNNKRLVGRTIEDLDDLKRNWRSVGTAVPRVTYQNDASSVSFWPPPGAAGTAVFEYPKALSFAAGTSTLSLPAWTRYTAADYVAYRAYLRAGPNQDINRALKRKARFQRKLRRLRSVQAAFFAERSPHLRPGAKYEGDILNPGAPLVP
jgi:hypothetical protein